MPRHIVIVGGGSAGWMTAAALAKNLAPAHFTISLIESTQLGAVSVGEATIPQIRQFNQMLGINKMNLYRETGNIFRDGTELFDVLSWFSVMHGQAMTNTFCRPASHDKWE